MNIPSVASLTLTFCMSEKRMRIDFYKVKPGKSLPLEVALMELVCRPPASSHVIQLLDWFEEPDQVILVLELPSPCLDVSKFTKQLGSYMEESLAWVILRQLIDFGCRDLLKKVPYKQFAGTRSFQPPEWVMDGAYHGGPTTVWSLGVLLFATVVCGTHPFRGEDDIIAADLHFKEGLSMGEKHWETFGQLALIYLQCG
ncbi:hypothetical protein AAFF_G00092370 [Aldrovandia affinis]|uniref:non-specific serine/threonine protein kinase n=1 Tax=Aldrovandia affinis TaxID=143900 RepID=A0AAD7T4E3_9TELE|nr:hypothetical protein AAFF_G00092370 [Aldrovandia affinis]